jgi:hypothetical protein
MDKLERVTRPHSSKATVDKVLPSMLTEDSEKAERKKSSTFIRQVTGESLKIH